MIDHYHNKARYPDPPTPSVSWSGWRRPQGSMGMWEHVKGSDRPTRGECYEALMQLSELVGSDEEKPWVYMIVPTGQRPESFARRRGGV